jgi:hypothetical protein
MSDASPDPRAHPATGRDVWDAGYDIRERIGQFEKAFADAYERNAFRHDDLMATLNGIGTVLKSIEAKLERAHRDDVVDTWMPKVASTMWLPEPIATTHRDSPVWLVGWAITPQSETAPILVSDLSAQPGIQWELMEGPR